jgi:uncharacterized repeat protein (TIGR01451 family)
MSRRLQRFSDPQRFGWVVLVLAAAIGLVGMLHTPSGVQPAMAAAFDESCLAGAVLWANATDQDETLRIGGRKNSLVGGVHSNDTLRIGGDQHLISGAVTYVTAFEDTGKENSYPTPQQVDPQPVPLQLDRTLFQPGGAVAQAANRAGVYQYVDGDLDVDNDHPLRDGLYYVTGNVKIKANGTAGKVTIIAAGLIRAELAHVNWEPAIGGLLFVSYAPSAKNAIELTLNDSVPHGLLYAPDGVVQLGGKSALLYGTVLADRIDLRASELGVIFDATLCDALDELPASGATPTAIASPTEMGTPSATPSPQPSPNMTDLPLSTPSTTATALPTETSTPTVTPTPSATTIPATVPAPATLRTEKVDFLWQDVDGDDQLSPGDIMLYTIFVTNLGPGTVTDLIVRDRLDPGMALLAGTVESDRGVVVAGNAAGDGEALVEIDQLAAAETINIRLRVRVNPYNGASQLQNQAEVSFRDGALGASVQVIYSDDPDTPVLGDPTVTRLSPMQSPFFLPLVRNP